VIVTVVEDQPMKLVDEEPQQVLTSPRVAHTVVSEDVHMKNEGGSGKKDVKEVVLPPKKQSTESDVEEEEMPRKRKLIRNSEKNESEEDEIKRRPSVNTKKRVFLNQSEDEEMIGSGEPDIENRNIPNQPVKS
jgi:DNA polymerase subunit Cdc27